MTKIILEYILPALASLITLVWSYKNVFPPLIKWVQDYFRKQKESNVMTDSHKLTMSKGVNDFHESQLKWAFKQLDIMDSKCVRNQQELSDMQHQCILLRETLTSMHTRLLEAKSTIVKFSQFTCANALTCTNQEALHKKNKTEFEIDVPDIKFILNPIKKIEE